MRKNASLKTVAEHAVSRTNRLARLWQEALGERRLAQRSDDPSIRSEAFKTYGSYDNKCSRLFTRWNELNEIATRLAEIAKVDPPRDIADRS